MTNKLRAIASAIRPLLHSKTIEQRIKEIKIIAQDDDITFEEARGVYNDRKADISSALRGITRAEIASIKSK